jgi:hypothetical protein
MAVGLVDERRSALTEVWFSVRQKDSGFDNFSGVVGLLMF